MRIAQAAFGFLVVPYSSWHADWAYGLPLIVLIVLIHVLGLGLINQKVNRVASGAIARRHPTSAFVLLVGTTTLLITILHWTEACIWATAYWLLGALPDLRCHAALKCRKVCSRVQILHSIPGICRAICIQIPDRKRCTQKG
jgi:hypothetical protein